MNNTEQIGQLSWEGIKLLFKIILNNLPTLLIWIAIGFAAGIVLAVVFNKLAKKWHIFSGPQAKPFHKYLRISYKVVSFLAVMFLVTTFCTYIGAKKIVQNEIEHAVGSGVSALETAIFQDEQTKENMYEMINVIHDAGELAQSFNHALAEAAVQEVNKKEGNGYFVSMLTKYLAVPQIEEKLWEFETAILFYATAHVAAKAGLDDISPGTYEAFTKGLNKWMESDFEASSIAIKSQITDFICGYVLPFVFGVFLPFLLIAVGIILIPVLHSFIAKKRAEKLVA